MVCGRTYPAVTIGRSPANDLAESRPTGRYHRSVPRMVPFPMLPTDSTAERRLYEGFLEQLAPEYVVYHSVDWILAGKRAPIEGEADFIVAHPLDGILVLEAKGGRLAYDVSTKRWTQSGRSGAHVLDEDPFHQARDEMHSLVEILSAQDGWHRWMPSYGFGVAMPDGAYQIDAHPAAPHEIAIDRGDMNRLAERVREVMRYWRHPGRTFGAEGMDRLARALGFTVEIRTPLKLEFDEEDRKIVELTDDQAWILAFITHRGRAVVTGPAGSGKTLLAVQIARRLAEGGHRTLLTCFNKALGEYLRRSAEGVDRLDVLHFHDLCVRTAREAGLTLPPVSAEPEDAYFERELPDLLVRAASRLGPRYGAIVVDEAQDFRESWWPALLRLHTDPEHGFLYLFADDNQNLYGGALPLTDAEMSLPPLPANLRNTEAIHQFVSVFYKGGSRTPAKGPPGRPPEILAYDDDEGLAHLLAVVLQNLVEGERVPLEDIVVLTPSGPRKSRLGARGRVDGFRLSDRLEDGTVLTSSVHGFEGLERPVVILAELGEEHVNDVPRYVYVGGSRAVNHLIVLAAEPVARRLRELTRARDP
jgi:AAA domain